MTFMEHVESPANCGGMGCACISKCMLARGIDTMLALEVWRQRWGACNKVHTCSWHSGHDNHKQHDDWHAGGGGRAGAPALLGEVCDYADRSYIRGGGLCEEAVRGVHHPQRGVHGERPARLL